MKARVIFAVFLALPGFAVGDAAVSVDASGFVEFATLDSDRNGYVSRVEARSVRGVEAHFSAADDDRDGLLDRREYQRARQNSLQPASRP